MKKIIASVLAMFILNISFGQSVSFNPRTGDVEMDGVLQDINTKAKEDLGSFVNNVSQKFNIAKTKIDELLKIMAPGDVFMSAQTAEIVKKPIETVAETYTKNKDKGWGQIAKELGIKPGSPEFHELKKKMKGGKEHGNGGGHGKGKNK